MLTAFKSRLLALPSRLCGPLAGKTNQVEIAELLRREVETTLRELCAALKACDVLLTNDSGPMHVAAAVGTPVVVPFGSTSSALTGPGLPEEDSGSRHQLLSAGAVCSPCFLREGPIDFRCMTGISAGMVAEAVLRVFASR